MTYLSIKIFDDDELHCMNDMTIVSICDTISNSTQ